MRFSDSLYLQQNFSHDPRASHQTKNLLLFLFSVFKMLTRLNILRRGCFIPQMILTKCRSIPVTPHRANATAAPPPPPSTPSSPPAKKKDPASGSTRSTLSASEISEVVLRRLHFREQRGVVKALIIGSGIVIVSTVLFLYVFRTPLKNQTVAQVADVAKSSLEQGTT